MSYRGRLAPSPTGYFHLGHARTFWTAWKRCHDADGTLVFRNEDLDPDRCKPEFVAAMYEDLRWLGLDWDEGPPESFVTSSSPTGIREALSRLSANSRGGPHAPYAQSRRTNFYLSAWRKLLAAGHIYPCSCSRKDLAQSASAPHEDDENDEPLYSGKCRPCADASPRAMLAALSPEILRRESPAGINWRFRVPDGESIAFDDLSLGVQSLTAGRDFGDFVIWRRDDVPAYQLAVVVDDAEMQITEVVRGEDLLRSTARQILLQRALGLPRPAYYHCALVKDENGVRLAKRHDALSLRTLRTQGVTPADVIARFQ